MVLIYNSNIYYLECLTCMQPDCRVWAKKSWKKVEKNLKKSWKKVEKKLRQIWGNCEKVEKHFEN